MNKGLYRIYLSKTLKKGSITDFLSKGSQSKYINALELLSDYFQSKNYITNTLYEITDIKELELLDDKFKTDLNLKEKNARRNNDYTAAFHHYVNMIKSNDEDNVNLDETVDTKSYYEGAVKKNLVKRYERDRTARKICLEAHGYTCKICSFNFEETYGEIGKGFIHVHHVKPLYEINQEYEIDPINDLIPVCPNCHAMIHKEINLSNITIDDFKKKLKLKDKF